MAPNVRPVSNDKERSKSTASTTKGGGPRSSGSNKNHKRPHRANRPQKPNRNSPLHLDTKDVGSNDEDVELSASPHRIASFNNVLSPTFTVATSVGETFSKWGQVAAMNLRGLKPLPPRGLNAFQEIEREFLNSPHVGLLDDMDSDAINGFSDMVAYKLENAIAANSNTRFYILLGLACFFTLVVAVLWGAITKYDGGAHQDTSNMGSAVFMVYQVLLTGGYDDSIQHLDQRFLFAFMVLVGITLISILIGLITDSVNEYMNGLSSGATKVVESGHTLILGWNESTVRAIVQIAFLRRVFKSQNDTWLQRLLPFLRVEPSSPVAAAPIVVMTLTKSKKVMEETVKAAFAERNVVRRYTRVGHDVVFRSGDPTDTHDLVRVAAQKATSVLVMMTEVDREESEDSGGSTSNSATIRTVLALRTIIYSNGLDPASTFNPNLRVVVHLSEPCKYLSAASFVAPNTNRSVLYAQDLSRNINSLMFYCASKPGLSRVLMALYDFENDAFRCRPVSELRAGGLPSRRGHGSGKSSSCCSSKVLLNTGQVGWFVGKTMAEAMRHHGWSNAVVVGCGDSIVPAIAPTVNDQNNAGGGSGSSKKGGGSWASSSRISAGLSSSDDKKKKEKKKKKAAHGNHKITVEELSSNERVQQRQEKVAHRVGLVNDPSRVITADDYIIFISKTSTPSLAQPFSKDRKDWATLAKPFVKAVLKRLRAKQAKQTQQEGGGPMERPRRYSDGDEHNDAVAPRHILVCGWRPEWDSDPARFYKRVTDISSGLATGSSITCLNVKTFETFNKLMGGLDHGALKGTSLDVGASVGSGSGFSGGFERVDSSTAPSPMPSGGGGCLYDRRSQAAPPPPSSSSAAKLPPLAAGVANKNAQLGERHNPSSWTINDPSVPKGISVRHYSADPTDYDGVAPLLSFDNGNQSALSFDTAICLGSVVGKHLAPAARDARVLSMLLVLRSLAKPGQGMHVIAENQQDQTSGLAVCPPTNDGASHEPDFINTQAIIARSLVQNLAYPQMQAALSELLSHGVQDAGADLDFLTSHSCGIADKEVAVGVVQRIILELYQSRAQCIGFFEGAKLVLNPRASQKVHWSAKHRIIVIVRGGTKIDLGGLSKKKGGSTGASSGDDDDDGEDGEYNENMGSEGSGTKADEVEDENNDDEEDDEDEDDRSLSGLSSASDDENEEEEEEEEEEEGHGDYREEGVNFHSEQDNQAIRNLTGKPTTPRTALKAVTKAAQRR